MPTKNVLMEKLAAAEAELARLRARDCDPIRSPSEIVRLIRENCQTEQESFVVVYLNARQKPLATREVARGTLADVPVHPREVFRDAVRLCAHSIVVGHNHPSGDPNPSNADLDLTQRLQEAGKVLGIPLLDHVVVTEDSHVSLAQRGYL